MPTTITLVGLGPGDPLLITRAAWEALAASPHVYLRTRQHAAVASLPKGPSYESFDDLYDQIDDLSEVHHQIAERLLDLAIEQEGLTYAVPGDALSGDATTSAIRSGAAERGIELVTHAGISWVDAACALLEVDAQSGLQVHACEQVIARLHPNLDPDVPALIMQLGNRYLASQLKLTLMNLYPDGHPIRLITALGTPQAHVISASLHELDRQASLDHLACVYLGALPERSSVASHQDVIARLRAPDGCPWDREQTHTTMRTNLLEETYEVLDALDSGDMDKLCEELGDLMLQIIMHVQIATEEGDFRLVDAVAANIAKLVRRHPHVFGDAAVSGSEEVLRNWEQIKRQERNDAAKSLLDGVSRALPSLLQSFEMQRRVARVGFDWPNLAGVQAKFDEELAEWCQAQTAAERASELGDVLFSLVNLARWYELDPESALRETNQRFARRFAYLERCAHQQGVALEDCTLETMDAWWDQAKQEEERNP